MEFMRRREVSPTLLGISESISDQWHYVMWMVSGEDRCALVDSGIGLLPDLKETVAQQAAGRPVTCLLTHSDPDHVGGGGLFDEVFLAPLDYPDFDKVYAFDYRMRCLDYATDGNEALLRHAAEHMLPTVPVAPRPVEHGDRFDLGGGAALEAFWLPGHTAGSTCFIHDKGGFALVGDAITKIPLLDYDRCPPLEVYWNHLKAFHRRTNGMQLFCGHSFYPLGNQNVRDILAACERVLAGKGGRDAADPFYSYPELLGEACDPRIHDYGSIRLRYDANKLFAS